MNKINWKKAYSWYLSDYEVTFYDKKYNEIGVKYIYDILDEYLKMKKKDKKIIERIFKDIEKHMMVEPDGGRMLIMSDDYFEKIKKKWLG